MTGQREYEGQPKIFQEIFIILTGAERRGPKAGGQNAPGSAQISVW
jgi:hypothetical protein